MSEPTSPGERVTVVTGAASGIGRATAAEILARGETVVVVDRDGDRAGTAVQELLAADSSGHAVAIRTDMGVADDVEQLFTTVADRFGRLDAVVNNAGVQRSGPVTAFAESDWDAMFAVNPKSCFLAAKFAVPLLAESGGAIVNVASIAGLRGGPGQTAYSASKGAIVAFSRALANELAPQGIRVNCLAPGWVDTPFNAPAIENMGGRAALDALVSSSVPLQRQGTPEEIAKVAAFLASADASYMTGQTIVVDGGQI